MNKVKAILPHHQNTSRVASSLQSLAMNDGKPLSRFVELVTSFVVSGWSHTTAALGVTNAEEPDTSLKAFIGEYSDIGDKTLMTYKVDGDKIIITGNDVAAWIKDNYTSKGAVIAVSGTRRSYALPVANFIRETLGLSPIEAECKPIEDNLENALAANLMVAKGAQKVTAKDLLNWLVQYATEFPAFKEADLVRLGVGRGVAQQLTRVWKLSKKFPTLKIIDRIQSGSLEMPHKEKAKELLDTKVKRGEKEKAVKTVEAELSGQEAKRSNRADKRALENVIENSSCHVVQFVVDAINRNSLDELLKTTEPFADQLNQVFQWESEEPEH